MMLERQGGSQSLWLNILEKHGKIWKFGMIHLTGQISSRPKSTTDFPQMVVV